MGFLLPTLIVLILDRLSKVLFSQLDRNFDVIDGIIRITMVKNTGAIFGLFQGMRFVFILASILAAVLITVIALKLPRYELHKRAALGLILGGALGNLIDRIHPGEVIDFIDMGFGIHRWPVYNVADIGVTVGALMLIVAYLRAWKTDGR